MAEIKWDIKRGAEIYGAVYDPRLKKWISDGRIRPGDVVVWRSGFSGWRKPEELDELKPFFRLWEMRQLRRIKRKARKERAFPSKRKIKNILIVEDEKDLCELLYDSLSPKVSNIAIANTKKDAIASLKRQSPDLVFLDLKLPDGDGMRFLSKLKRVSPKTRVNIISAYGSDETKEEAKAKGAYCFIDKPFAEKDILKSIK